MKNEMKTANDFSRNLDERTSDLMLDVYNEIKMSDKLFSQQEHNAQSDISEIVEDDNNRTEVVQFRVSKKELEVIDRRLEKSSHKSRSSYLRDCALNTAVINFDLHNFDEYLKELRRIGNNINQIAVRVNLTSNFYKEDIMEIKRGMELIWQRLNSTESEVRSISQLNTSLTLGKPETVRLLFVMVAALRDRLHKLNLKMSESKEVEEVKSLHST
mgnify:FL=1